MPQHSVSSSHDVPSLPKLDFMHRQFKRQYIFVAATMPSEGKKSIAKDLRQKFPGLIWLAGDRLHQGLSTVSWKWRETTQDTWKAALQVALPPCPSTPLTCSYSTSHYPLHSGPGDGTLHTALFRRYRYNDQHAFQL